MSAVEQPFRGRVFRAEPIDVTGVGEPPSFLPGGWRWVVRDMRYRPDGRNVYGAVHGSQLEAFVACEQMVRSFLADDVEARRRGWRWRP